MVLSMALFSLQSLDGLIDKAGELIELSVSETDCIAVKGMIHLKQRLANLQVCP